MQLAVYQLSIFVCLFCYQHMHCVGKHNKYCQTTDVISCQENPPEAAAPATRACFDIENYPYNRNSWELPVKQIGLLACGRFHGLYCFFKKMSPGNGPEVTAGCLGVVSTHYNPTFGASRPCNCRVVSTAETVLQTSNWLTGQGVANSLQLVCKTR